MKIGKDKIITVILSVSMFLIGVSTIVTTGANLLGITLPDLLIRSLGLVNILSLVTLFYSNVKKLQMQKDALLKGAHNDTRKTD